MQHKRRYWLPVLFVTIAYAIALVAPLYTVETSPEACTPDVTDCRAEGSVERTNVVEEDGWDSAFHLAIPAVLGILASIQFCVGRARWIARALWTVSAVVSVVLYPFGLIVLVGIALSAVYSIFRVGTPPPNAASN